MPLSSSDPTICWPLDADPPIDWQADGVWLIDLRQTARMRLEMDEVPATSLAE